MAIQLSNKSDEQLEKEIREANLIPKNAICDFEVLEEVTWGAKTITTKDDKSKAGNDMIVLVLKIYFGERFITLIDYLTAGNERMEFKLRHAVNSCGVISKGAISAKDFIGKSGKCKIGIQKDKDGAYPDKNIVQDYVPKSTVVSAELEDSIPDFR